MCQSNYACGLTSGLIFAQFGKKYSSKTMKKILFISLLGLCYTNLFAQNDSTIVKIDTSGAKKDSLKKVSIEKTSTKKRKAEKDSIDVSYAEEFRREQVRFTWGLRGGINLSQMALNNINPVRVQANGLPQLNSSGRVIRDEFLANSQYSLGYVGGLFLRMTRGSFYFQPEALYSVKSGKFDILQSDGKLASRVETSVSAVDIPLLFGIRFRQGRIFAGPVGTFAFQTNQKLVDALKNYTIEDAKTGFLLRPTLNVHAGLGFEFEHVVMDIRYEFGLSNYSDYTLGISSSPANFSFRQNMLQLTVGLIR